MQKNSQYKSSVSIYNPGRKKNPRSVGKIPMLHGVLYLCKCVMYHLVRGFYTEVFAIAGFYKSFFC